MIITFLQQHFLECIAIIIALLALLVSFSAKHYAEKAFTLGLFDKRYKLYYDFKMLLNGLSLRIDKKPLPEHLDEVKLLLWEAQYIYGKDINDLLNNLKECLSGTALCFELADNMASGFQQENQENYNEFHKHKETYNKLHVMLMTLFGENKSTNLNSYFHKYLSDNAFRKPLKTPFWQQHQR
ncbi:hypothetical protein AYO45_01425 [Gammaproteobacteria bacterium SCGC AG-212-F23]|nr:hypothetical protein AYO45_01425 [Gammaproteobacteria bacterium SCGC AG-212-F23]